MTTTSRPIAAGDDIDTFCRKCDLDLAHIVIAVERGKPRRVECKTCRTPHAYKAPPAVKAPSTRKPRTAAQRSKAAENKKAAANSLERALVGRDQATAAPYSTTHAWSEGDLIAHPRFALGVVQRLLSDHKVEVLFAGPGGTEREPGTLRILVHDRRQN